MIKKFDNFIKENNAYNYGLLFDAISTYLELNGDRNNNDRYEILAGNGEFQINIYPKSTCSVIYNDFNCEFNCIKLWIYPNNVKISIDFDPDANANNLEYIQDEELENIENIDEIINCLNA